MNFLNETGIKSILKPPTAGAGKKIAENYRKKRQKITELLLSFTQSGEGFSDCRNHAAIIPCLGTF